MTKRFGAAAVALVAMALVSPVRAERPISGAELQRALAGKAFLLRCIDGTYGRGFFNNRGIVTVSYRRPTAGPSAAETRDHAVVQVRGNELCLAWQQFGGGGNSCYPVAQMAPHHFRLGVTGRWCDISAQ